MTTRIGSLARHELDKADGVLRAGLIGRGIQLSRTPGMHMAEGARLGLSYSYHLFDFDLLDRDDHELPDFIETLRAGGYAGFNITHPFKEAVIPWLDALSPNAESIGAVNTVVFNQGRAIGHNTDCWGFAESFRRGLDAACLDCVVLVGAGGAGLAVAKALVDLGAQKIFISDINTEKAAGVVDDLQGRFGTHRISLASDLDEAIAGATGLINATPVGMAKYPGMPVSRAVLRPDLWVADVIYFPMETELLRVASGMGCRVLPGEGMAIYQAVRAFALLTGAAPDAEQMAAHFHAL